MESLLWRLVFRFGKWPATLEELDLTYEQLDPLKRVGFVSVDSRSRVSLCPELIEHGSVANVKLVLENHARGVSDWKVFVTEPEKKVDSIQIDFHSLKSAVEEHKSLPTLEIMNFAPKTLELYAFKLQQGFEALGSGIKSQTVIKGSEAFLSALDEDVDFSIVQIHGCETEDPLFPQKFPGKRVCLIHRPEEFLLRHGLAGVQFIDQEAHAVVVLGKSIVPLYQRLFPLKPVVAIPHGFFESGHLDESRLEPDSVVFVGSVTTWGEMRYLSDLLELSKPLLKSGKKVVVYAGGKFDKRSRVTEFISSEQVWVLDHHHVEKSFLNREFSDENTFRNWIFEKSHGRVVVNLSPFSDDSLSSWENAIIDFNLQAYREILKAGAPKVEASGTLHKSGGPSIAVVIDCPAMRDILEVKGMNWLLIPYKSGAFDFTAAAEKVIKLIDNPILRREIISGNIDASKKLTMREVAFAHVQLLRTLKSL